MPRILFKVRKVVPKINDIILEKVLPVAQLLKNSINVVKNVQGTTSTTAGTNFNVDGAYADK